MLTVVEAPHLPPGSCWFCRSANRDTFVDTSRSDDFLGQCYICDQCIREMANLYGFMDPVQAKSLQETLERYEQRLKESDIKQQHLEAIVDSFTALRGQPNHPLGSGPDPVVTTPVHTEKSTYPALTSGNEVADGEGKTAEPVHDEGMVKLRATELGDGFSLSI